MTYKNLDLVRFAQVQKNTGSKSGRLLCLPLAGITTLDEFQFDAGAKQAEEGTSTSIGDLLNWTLRTQTGILYPLLARVKGASADGDSD